METKDLQSEVIRTFFKKLDEKNLEAAAIRYVQWKYKNYDTRDRGVYNKIMRHSSGSRKN